jgi:putative MATE family efflux protein
MSNNALYSYQNIIRVAVPIIIGGIAQNIVSVTDTVFLGKLSETALGAAGNAGIFYFFIIMLALGLVTGAQILMGNNNGARNYTEVGQIFTHTFLLIIPLSILLFIILHFYGISIFNVFISDEDIKSEAIIFIQYRSWGVFFALFNFLIIAFYTAITETKIISWVTIIMSLTNVILDYAMIFGRLGFVAMGVKGAALASVYSEIVASVLFMSFILIQNKRKIYQLFKFSKIELQYFTDILKLGFPVMIQFLLSIGSWFTFFMLIEKLGKFELASAHIVRSIYMVLMIPLFGFSNTTNTLVSNMLGAKESKHISLLLKRVIILCLSVTAVLFILINIFPTPIIMLFTNSADLIDLSVKSLRVIGYTMFLFSVAFILFNAVLGAGMTKEALAIEASTITIYLSFVYTITIIFPQPLPIVWMSEFVYMGLLALFSYWVLNRKLRVKFFK